jgi:hypothetical protein
MVTEFLFEVILKVCETEVVVARHCECNQCR